MARTAQKIDFNQLSLSDFTDAEGNFIIQNTSRIVSCGSQNHSKKSKVIEFREAECAEEKDAEINDPKENQTAEKPAGKNQTDCSGKPKTWRQRKDEKIKMINSKRNLPKIEKPDSIKAIEYNGGLLSEWMEKLGCSYIEVFNFNYRHTKKSFIYKCEHQLDRTDHFRYDECVYPENGRRICLYIEGDKIFSTVTYVDENGNVWMADVQIDNSSLIKMEYDYRYSRDYKLAPESKNIYIEESMLSISKWKHAAKLIPQCTPIQNASEIAQIFQRVSPYGYKWADENNIDYSIALMCPHFELLDKAGFVFMEKVKRMICGNTFSDSMTRFVFCDKGEIENLNRLVQNGRNLREIFKTPKIVYSELKNEGSLSLWDVYRKLDKSGRMSGDTFRIVHEQNYTKNNLESINSILNKKYNGKPVFTWNSLVNYLNRVDQFEAIDTKEALQLLSDYLMMCSQLEMEPKIDGDSLKREHDVTARTLRQKKDEIIAKKMTASCKYMEKYNYEEDTYFIRAVRNYDDLLDEAKQQHNCVAGYAHNIAQRKSLIFFMRWTESPDRSLITVELSSDKKTIRQAYLAYNKPVHSKEQSDFLKRWLDHVKKIKD